jgi:hypothetical protein
MTNLAQQTMNKVRDITNLLYDEFGEDITPEKQIELIQNVLKAYEKPIRRCKTNSSQMRVKIGGMFR